MSIVLSAFAYFPCFFTHYRPSTWSVCPEGFFLNGLYRTSGHNLHNIEEGKCCKPVTHPKSYEHCYNEYIRYEFDKQGWTTCKKTGYYVAGVYRDHNKDWLHDIDYLKCCKMWTGNLRAIGSSGFRWWNCRSKSNLVHLNPAGSSWHSRLVETSKFSLTKSLPQTLVITAFQQGKLYVCTAASRKTWNWNGLII